MTYRAMTSDMSIDRTTITKEELGELEAEELPVPVTILDASCSDDEMEASRGGARGEAGRDGALQDAEAAR